MRTDFEPIAGKAAQVFHADSRLPQPVFTEPYSNFGFLEFLIGRPEFWCLLQRLATWGGDKAINVIAIDPNYPRETQGRHGVLRIPVTEETSEYQRQLDTRFNDVYSDNMLSTTYVLAWFSDSLDWAIWGERFKSTLVVGFRREPPVPFAQLATECDMHPWPLEEILDLVMNDFGLFPRKPHKPEQVRAWQEYCEEFRRNYSPPPEMKIPR